MEETGLYSRFQDKKRTGNAFIPYLLYGISISESEDAHRTGVTAMRARIIKGSG